MLQKILAFIFGEKLYTDDVEGEPLAKETSHPQFIKICKAEFYYDCTDEFSPFGNDDGADLLYKLEDRYREHNGRGNLTDWMFKTIDEFGFTYASRECSSILDEKTLSALLAEDPNFISTMDNTIIATAFGQLKITGKIDSSVKEIALNALERQQLLTGNAGDELTQLYLQRLQIMKADLQKVT